MRKMAFVSAIARESSGAETLDDLEASAAATEHLPAVSSRPRPPAASRAPSRPSVEAEDIVIGFEKHRRLRRIWMGLGAILVGGLLGL